MVVVANCGGGSNSYAYIMRWVNEGLPLDLVLFADTGGEMPDTYCHVEKLSHWLARRGYPEITTVKYTTRDGNTLTLEQRCLDRNMLPSVAYGYKKCSLKFKVSPMDKFLNNWQPARDIWERGEKVTKLIGFDAGEEHRVLNAISKPTDKKYDYKYPLYKWQMDRTACKQYIELNGMKQPGKSSCFFCPNMTKMEIREMAHKYPELAERSIEMERNAKQNLRVIKGLGRTWTWEDFLKQGEMFPEIFPEARETEICCNCYDG